MERVPVNPRQRVALSGHELELLAAHAPAYAQRMLLFGGTTGMRIGEIFTTVDGRVDLAGRTIFLPAALCKEAADKWIDLTGEETTLAREQLLVRAPGTPLLWPTKTGQALAPLPVPAARLVQGPLASLGDLARTPRPARGRRDAVPVADDERRGRARPDGCPAARPAGDGGDADARRRLLEGAGGREARPRRLGAATRPDLRRRRPPCTDAKGDRRARSRGPASGARRAAPQPADSPAAEGSTNQRTR
jgi:hypothetical protein